MKSSFYFRFTELIRTDTGKKNCPSTIEEVSNLVELAKALQNVRIICGFPVVVNSGYRSPEVNSAVGGVVNSKHLDGRAADISCSPFDFEKLSNVCKNLYELNMFTEYKVYSNYIHVAI